MRWLLRVPSMPLITNCWLRIDRRFICTAAFTMANSSGAATIVKPTSIRPLRDLGQGKRIARILAACSCQKGVTARSCTIAAHEQRGPIFEAIAGDRIGLDRGGRVSL